ncbi:hypothetical protein SAMN02745123_02985 [Desulforamulus aeronauticus DSM 10349]|uniref:Uncharacterized protein n=1 Tax=Desulforamulus aeronauticus DSM 10349 TaxID=1121421 RepID=A0A1M6UYQ7_9FIRM|nr:hypothetical protein SAMN02745123_02985 [Desulforamulus aeronauticus DSM 10349]
MRAHGQFEHQIVVTIVLDSHIASELHKYRVSRQRMRGDIRQAIEEFLSYVTRYNFDYNPTFYLLESYFKSDPKVFVDKVAPVATSIVYLHSMDEERFLKTKEILLKPDAIDYYLTKFNVRTIEDCGRAWVEEYIGDSKKIDNLVQLINLSYVCLLKMTLIHKKDKRPIEKKLDEFESFMTEELGLRLARESHLAMYCFADLAGSFIGVQAGMNFEKAKRILCASAWDIFLIRFPEQLLSPRYLPEMNLAFACTAEKKLAELGELLTLERLLTRSDEEISIPTVSMNLSKLEEKLGRDTATRLMAASEERTLQQILKKERKAINHHKLRYLIEDLEVQLSYLCKSR